jgi:putative membrane protein
MSAAPDPSSSPDAPPPPAETLRLHQANERTMLAWIRTGIALMAFGFAIARFGVFLREVASVGRLPVTAPHSLGSAWVGAALVALGMMANLMATIRYGRIRASIERGNVGAPSALMVYVLGATATLVGLAMTVLLARALGD